ncbi:MAG: hypothetical protein MUO61_03585 [Dehalococcoidia bacterium]|nr:hypothetical protein [Dehalococcoidia bacterium]
MTLQADINGFIDPILSAFVNDLKYRMNGYLVTAYLRGSAQMVEWGRTKTTDMPIYYEGPPIQDALNYALEHTATLVKGLNDETRDQMRQVIENAIKEKRGVDGLSRDLRKVFDDMSMTRSQVISRTETCDALEQSFIDRAKDMGVTGKEWIVTDPCEICEENGNAGVIGIDEDFPSGDSRPPAHPNAVFAESSFIPYGGLLQIVRSQYGGPAWCIKTDRVSFTIGPNHPILTGRGWVKASEVKQGDQLVYDSRTEHSGVSRMQSYFNEMPTIQDVFNSLVPTFGYATIASPRTYFHGDEIFAYGEVDVVLPTRNLLPVLDIMGIKEFCESNFMGSNTNIPCMAGIGSSHNACKGVGIATPSIVGSPNLIKSLFRGHLLPSLFNSTTVTHIETLHYNGWAYDASTSTGLYNSSGIIVKNCRCALAPVMLK